MSDIVISFDPLRSQSTVYQGYRISISPPDPGQSESPLPRITIAREQPGRPAPFPLYHDLPPELASEPARRTPPPLAAKSYRVNEDRPLFISTFSTYESSPERNPMTEKFLKAPAVVAKRSYGTSIDMFRYDRGVIVNVLA